MEYYNKRKEMVQPQFAIYEYKVVEKESRMKRFESKFLTRQLTTDQFTYNQVIGMLIPLVLDQLFIYAISLLTMSMISSSGQDSVTAVSLVTPVNFMITMIQAAFCSGGAVVIAQYKGHGDSEKVQVAIGQTVWFSICITTIMSLAVFFASGPIVETLFGAAEASVKSKAKVYLAGMALNLIIHAPRTATGAGLRGVGDNKHNLYGSLLVNVSYFFFSLVFLNWLKMDIEGTLLAYCLARTLGLISSAYFLFFQKNGKVRIRIKQMLLPKKEYIKSIWRLGVPFSTEELFFNGGTILVSSYMVLLGTTSVAAHAIANSVFTTLYAPLTAVGILATTVVGQCIGAGRRDLAKHYGKKLVQMGYIVAILFVLLMLPLLRPILDLYNPEPEALKITWKLLFIGMGGMVLFMPASTIMPYTLRAAGDAYYSTAVSMVTMWAIRVGLGFLVSVILDFGIEGIWICMAVEWILRSALFIVRYCGNAWLKKKNVIEAEAESAGK